MFLAKIKKIRKHKLKKYLKQNIQIPKEDNVGTLKKEGNYPSKTPTHKKKAGKLFETHMHRKG